MNDKQNSKFSYNPHRPHSGGSHDSSISSSTSSHSTVVSPASGMLTTASHSRNSGTPALTQLHSSSRSSTNPSLTVYGHPYGNSSTSPSTTSSVFQDGSVLNENGYATAGISPTHLSPSLSKRPYRQRRKDPSCDACRERKVKCDATEMQSCSECTTRGVKCQFTKDTNRRMSSIKQVQDLQSQLVDLREEVEQLRAARREESSNLNLPEIRPTTERKNDLPALRDLGETRHNTRLYAKSIFKVPPLYRQLVPPQTMLEPDSLIPPKALTDKLLHQYYYSVHRLYPILHWPTFHKAVEQMYSNGSWDGVPQVWASVFFAVLACGTLQTPESASSEEAGRPTVHGVEFMRLSSRSVNTWTDEIRMDHARAALLLCHFLTEMNMKSAGWVWLGSCVRISQDIGLHIETGPWGAVEEELRRRLWWCTYATDRLLSLESGKPCLINDEDCQVGWPCPIDEDLLDTKRFAKLSPTSAAHTTLATVIPVVRFISQLKTTLKSRRVANQTLLTYDEYFDAVMSTFPDTFQLRSTSYLEPHNLAVAFFLQAARFHLYRHNLSPVCAPQERLSAQLRCYHVAKDTVHYIARTLQTPSVPPVSPGGSQSEHDIPQNERWRVGVRSTAINASCAHLWRCALILSFRGDYDAVASCVRVCAAIGNLRSMNMACGKHLKFFLTMLLERWKSGRARPEMLEQDEEMIAYMSGDLQGSSESSWIWAGSETGSKLNANSEGNSVPIKLERHGSSNSTGVQTSTGRPTGATPGVSGSGTKPTQDPATAMRIWRQAADWGGWETIEPLLHQLKAEQQKSQNSGDAPRALAPAAEVERSDRGWDSRSEQSYQQTSHNSNKRRQLGPPDVASPAATTHNTTGSENLGSPPAATRSAGANRISIANII